MSQCPVTFHPAVTAQYVSELQLEQASDAYELESS